jgi:predicted metal-dependent hydrolase
VIPQSPHQLRLPGLDNTRPLESKPHPGRKVSIPSGKHILPSTYKTTFEGRTISFTVKRSRKARLARLEITPDTGLTVVIPAFCDMDRIEGFLKKKGHWIFNKLVYYSLIKHRTTSNLKNGDMIPYLGSPLQIEIQDGGSNGGDVTLSNNKLLVAVKPGTTGLNPIIEKWYRTQARQIMKEKVDKHSVKMVVDYNKIHLKGQKTLWGSCSRKRNLNFNWRLIMTPESVIDYVVVHELSHLKEMNHTKKFWQVVAGYCPEWQQHRKWLKEHTVELNNILRV